MIYHECSMAIQEPKLEVPRIHKAYFSGLNFRGCTSKFYGPKYATVPYLHFRILKFPLKCGNLPEDTDHGTSVEVLAVRLGSALAPPRGTQAESPSAGAKVEPRRLRLGRGEAGRNSWPWRSRQKFIRGNHGFTSPLNV